MLDIIFSSLGFLPIGVQVVIYSSCTVVLFALLFSFLGVLIHLVSNLFNIVRGTASKFSEWFRGMLR